MAVTNAEIILTGMLEVGLDPETDVVNTFAGWKRLGYSVKRGETAVFKTRIWKPSKFKKDDKDTSTDVTQNTDDGKTDDNSYKKLILVPAAFFTQNQVEKIKKGAKTA